jgi:hypothetical protein
MKTGGSNADWQRAQRRRRGKLCDHYINGSEPNTGALNLSASRAVISIPMEDN